MFKRIRSWFWAGLLVLVPTGVTVWLFWWSWNMVDAFALRFLHGNFYRQVPGAGAVTVVARPNERWAAPWKEAIERSWSTASAG